MGLFSFLHGFWLGFGLIVAIGAQNAFILRQGLMQQHVFILCLIASLCDAILIIAGVAGFGNFIRSQPNLIFIVQYGGVAFLAIYGIIAFQRAYNAKAMNIGEQKNRNLKTAIATLLAFTFLNPHVYLDTVILLGALSLNYQGVALVLFAVGAIVASFSWFFALGYGASTLTVLFAKPKAWQILDVVIGCIMLTLALLIAIG